MVVRGNCGTSLIKSIRTAEYLYAIGMRANQEQVERVGDDPDAITHGLTGNQEVS